jgi:hypothetical protein
MPSYQPRTGTDVTDDILIRQREAEGLVSRLRGSPKRTAIDRGDIPAVAAPFEGQTMIQYADNSPYLGDHAYYYANGDWHEFTETPATGIQGVEGVSTTTITSGGLDSLVNFQAQSGGDNLLDFTVPNGPAFLANGLYGINVVIAMSEKLGAGKSARMSLAVELTRFSGGGPSNGDQYIGDGTITSPLPGMGAAVIVQAEAGDQFLCYVGNDDTITHHYEVATGSYVTKLG